MSYARLGEAGPVASRIALGMMGFGRRSWRDWVLPEDAAQAVVRRAVEAGITLFDTGNHYSVGASEQITGRLLRRFFSRREDYLIATKVGAVLPTGERGLSRRHILAAVDDSLRQLGSDYIDLYQIHRWDPHTPIEETITALHELQAAGKVRYLGAGSMHAWQFVLAHTTATGSGGPGFVSMQNHYNLAYREEEREMIPACRHLRVGVICWSPLARGLLTRPRDRAASSLRAATDTYARHLYTAADLDTVDALTTVADARGLPPAQIALAWLTSRASITAPIIGATQPTHIDDAVAALNLTLTPEENAALEAPYRPHPVRGHE
jgi:aryl-alcohol dehydrogenase-like predicted oxidoreductase